MVELQDETGNPVDGALAFMLSPDGSVVGPQVGRQLSDGTFQIRAIGPGTANSILIVRVSEEDGSFRGTTGVKQIGTLEIMVTDWPVSRIEMDSVTYTPYVGTTYKLTARAMTDRGTEHNTAVVEWLSDTPEVATVTTGGVLTLLKNGEARIVARTGEDIRLPYSFGAIKNPLRRLSIAPVSVQARTGDVVQFDVQALDKKGNRIEGIALSFSAFGIDSSGSSTHSDGSFVAERPGAFKVVVSASGMSAEAIVEAVGRPAATPVKLVGKGPVGHVATSDLWVFTGRDGKDYAYTGTHAQGGGQRMFVWDVTDPANVRLTDSVVVDARVVNDVKVNGDASWAIITREGASNRQNGLVVLDLADPAHPEILSQFTEGMTSGMHNTWIVGNIVYGVNDGRNWMDIVDLSNPAAPRRVGQWELRPGETDKSLHDVWSDGHGYLYLSYWDDGLVILDAGAGTHGGTATKPMFVSSIAYGMGNTHVAWRDRHYVFVGDEIFGCAECTNGPRGYIHVIDVSDIT
ncbi:MAG: LVIVD repeat-containing protein, partial [Gemmatimonadales bacterium]